MADPVAAGAIPSLEAIRSARDALAGALPPTPLLPARSLASAAHSRVHLKVESGLPTGSFKVRGALWALTRRLGRGPVSEVVAASTGNHGAAVAWAAARLGIPATIFVPAGANALKKGRIADLGARVVEGGPDLAAAAAASRDHVSETGAWLLDDATDSEVPSGAGTIGLEVVESLPEVRTVVVPVGDSALIRGVAAAVKALRPDAVVVGVQAREAPSYYLSWEAGHVVVTETCDTIADGLATRTPQPSSVVAVRGLVDRMVLVSEDALVEAMRRLARDEGLVVEPAAAASTAALAQGGIDDGGDTVLLVTGANLDPRLRSRLETDGSGRA